MSLLFTLGAFGVALGVLIVAHEFGHYLAARASNVKVLRFSVGFGRPLLVHRRGPDQTEWVIAAFPLGGYVKMLDEREGLVAPQELPRAFNRQPVYRRIAVVAAGPLANLVLAVALYWLLFLHGVPGLRPMLGEVPAASPAWTASLRQGDTLLAIGGEAVVTWEDVRWLLLQHVLQKKGVEVEARSEGGAVGRHWLDLSALSAADLENDLLKRLGLTLYRPLLPTRIGQVVAQGAADRAGLMVGDEIVAANGVPLRHWDDFVEAVRRHPGQRLQLEIRRAGGVRTIELVPEAVGKAGATVGRIGAAPQTDPAQLEKLLTEVRYPPLAALGQALRKTWDTSLFSLRMMGKMVVGEASWKSISGPITIADYAGQSAHQGWLPYLSFLALISISLGVLNLLPIPILDGGHLMYYMAEIIKGSPVSERTLAIGQQIGIAVLLLLMAFAFYNDINRLLVG